MKTEVKNRPCLLQDGRTEHNDYILETAWLTITADFTD